MENRNESKTNDNSNPQQGSRNNSLVEKSSASKDREDPTKPPPAEKKAGSTVDVSLPRPKEKHRKVSPNKKDDRKLFVGGIPGSISHFEFKQFFEQFGAVVDSVVLFDRATRRSRGFGFVTFEETAVAQKVLNSGTQADNATEKKVGKITIHGKVCEVKAAEPKMLADVPFRRAKGTKTTRTETRSEKSSVLAKGKNETANLHKTGEKDECVECKISGCPEMAGCPEIVGCPEIADSEIADPEIAGCPKIADSEIADPEIEASQCSTVAPSPPSATGNAEQPQPPVEKPPQNLQTPAYCAPSPYYLPSMIPYYAMHNPYHAYTHPDPIANQFTYYPFPETQVVQSQGGYYEYSGGHYADNTFLPALYGYPPSNFAQGLMPSVNFNPAYFWPPFPVNQHHGMPFHQNST